MSTDVTAGYEMVVGLEVHVQLGTRTKAFCSCSTDFGAPPNTNVCPVCLALPGSLPVLNENAVTLAVRAAVALGCTVHERSVFARKNYFYPDLPKGYQITQFESPLATRGKLAISSAGAARVVGITRLHLEEDAGKSIHDRYPGESAIDLNRAGVPLVEIVSEPDMRTPAEAGAYLRGLKEVLQHAGVSDVSMEEGSLRVDANVSARPKGETRLGTKTEVKNMNSFSAVERALAHEFRRQCAVLQSGGTVMQQTMLWDSVAGEVRLSRTKEASEDYRYFPEPDLLPLVLDKAWLRTIEGSLPELPDAKRKRFAADYKLTPSEAAQFIADPGLAEYFETLVSRGVDARSALNWVTGEVKGSLNARRETLQQFPVRPANLAELLGMISQGLVSHVAGKRIFARMVETGKPAAQIAHDEGLLQVGDDAAISSWIDDVLAENPVEAARYLSGERKLQGVLVGLVMKKSGGKADPKRVNQLLSSRAAPAGAAG